MPETVELTDIFLRVIGAFYAFAGYVATRAAMTSHFLDRAIAAIAAKKPTLVETAQNAWLLAGAALVLVGGVLLLAGLQLAVWVFAASTLAQAVYLFFLAPRFFDVADEPDPKGRQQTINAFVIYGAATAFIASAAYRERLAGLHEISTPALAAVASALLLYAGYVARTLWWTPRTGGLLGAMSGTAGDAPSLPPYECKRIKVMAEYHSDPLWAMDEDSYGCFPPEMLDISKSLTDDLNNWSIDYESSYDPDDPASSRWSEAEHAAHAAAGRPLAVRLKRERPDLMVYVLDGDIGAVEVHADDPI